MINFATARALVEKELLVTENIVSSSEYRLMIDDRLTITREFGWVFFWNTKGFIETQEDQYALYGNAPIIVDKEDGSIHYTGTGKSIEEYIQDFLAEKKRG